MGDGVARLPSSDLRTRERTNSRLVGLTESFVRENYAPRIRRDTRVLRPMRTTIWSSLTCSPSSVFPVLLWGPKLCKRNLLGSLANDLMCGLTVASIVIPQGVAYGALAGIPPIYGLYTAVVPPIIYAFTGSCMHLAVGPFALISMLTAEGVHSVVLDPENNVADAIDAAEILSLLVGIMLLVAGILRLGFVATFLSDPVRIGYTTAVSIAIPMTQLKYAFQVDVPRGTFFETLIHLVQGVQEKGANWEALAIFSVSLFSIWAMQAINSSPRKPSCLKTFPLPAELIVVLATTTGVAYFGLDSDVKVLGEIPAGLPTFTLPQYSKFDLRPMLSAASIITIMTYITAMSVSKTFGRRFHYNVDNNQELVSLGLANIAGSFFMCFPAAASLSRTAVAGQAGASTPLHGVFTVIILMGALLFAGPFLKTLPLAGLSAIVVMAFKSLLLGGYDEMKVALRVSKSDFLLFNIAFWSTLIAGVTDGIAIAVLANLFYLLWKSTRPAFYVLGRMKGQDNFFRDRAFYSQAEAVPCVLIFKFCAPLHFANREVFASGLWDALLAQDAEHSRQESPKRSPTSSPTDSTNFMLGGVRTGGVKRVVVDFSQVAHIDISAIRTLDKLREDLSIRDTKLIFADSLPNVYQMIDDMGMFKPYKDPRHDVVCFVNLSDAVNFAEQTDNLRMEQELSGQPVGARGSMMDKLALIGHDIGPNTPVAQEFSVVQSFITATGDDDEPAEMELSTRRKANIELFAAAS